MSSSSCRCSSRQCLARACTGSGTAALSSSFEGKNQSSLAAAAVPSADFCRRVAAPGPLPRYSLHPFQLPCQFPRCASHSIFHLRLASMVSPFQMTRPLQTAGAASNPCLPPHGDMRTLSRHRLRTGIADGEYRRHCRGWEYRCDSATVDGILLAVAPAMPVKAFSRHTCQCPSYFCCQYDVRGICRRFRKGIVYGKTRRWFPSIAPCLWPLSREQHPVTVTSIRGIARIDCNDRKRRNIRGPRRGFRGPRRRGHALSARTKAARTATTIRRGGRFSSLRISLKN